MHWLLVVAAIIVLAGGCTVALPDRWQVRPLNDQPPTQVSLDEKDCERSARAKAGPAYSICMLARGYEVKIYLYGENYSVVPERAMTELEIREAFGSCTTETNAALAPVQPYIDGNLMKFPVVNLVVVPLLVYDVLRVRAETRPILERTFPPCMTAKGVRTTLEHWGAR